MSINVELHASGVPYLVSPYESIFFALPRVKLVVESGNGYPGQGGCFYSHDGRVYVSQYRIVFVADAAQQPTAYRSFSLPFYCIRDWQFATSFFGAQTWRGHTNAVPGGGLVGVGTFTLSFLSVGFDEFQRHVDPLLASSRRIYATFASASQPSVLMVPSKLLDASEQHVAYVAVEDPMTLYVLANKNDKNDKNDQSTQDDAEDKHPAIV